VLPEMNFKARLLSGDIYKKRPGMNIEPGVFIDDLPSYSMIIGGKIDDLMIDVRIFSKGKQKEQTSIHAKSGRLNTLSDAFLLTLYDGEIHEIENDDFSNYRRIIFETHKIVIPASDLLLNRRDSSKRTDREMTIPMIVNKVNDYKTKLDLVHRRLAGSFYKTIGDSILPKSIEDGLLIITKAQNIISVDSTISINEKNKKERKLRNLERQLKNEFGLIATYLKGKNKYTVEAHKKFSIPFACILFVLLGAPLGVMAKRGGFAVSTSLSFGFFLIYYVLLIGGEELADRNQVSPEIGMWAPNIVLFIIASYLTIYTIRERAPISILYSFLSKKSKS
jgi:lipopolysaccharide export system permease protein